MIFNHSKCAFSQFQEQLEECQKYKDFLFSLTPKTWLDEHFPPPSHDVNKNKTGKDLETDEKKLQGHYQFI